MHLEYNLQPKKCFLTLHTPCLYLGRGHFRKSFLMGSVLSMFDYFLDVNGHQIDIEFIGVPRPKFVAYGP